MIRFALGEVLGQAGYTVLVAEDGARGIRVLDILAEFGREPDLTIADLVMDSVSGYEVIKHAKLRFPARPVIAISGGTRSMPPDLPLELAKRTGADASLQKPVSNDELLRTIRALIAAAPAKGPVT